MKQRHRRQNTLFCAEKLDFFVATFHGYMVDSINKTHFYLLIF